MPVRRYGYTRGWHRWAAAGADFLGQPLRRARAAPHPVRSILLIRVARFGDVVLALPALEHLRRENPAARIAWLVRPEYADFLRDAAPEAEIIPVRRGALRRRRFDLAFEFHGHPRWIAVARRHAAWISGHGIRGLGFLLDADAPGAGTAGLPVHESPRLSLAPTWQAAAAQVLGPRSEPFVLFHPGCGQPSKAWPEENWRALIVRCAAGGMQAVLAGGPDDRSLCARLASGLPGLTDIAGLTGWSGLAGTVARARAVVAPDTGIIHLARALGIPTVALFGPTDPNRWAAAAGKRDRVLSHALPCSHCDLGRCPALPRGSRFSPCLQAISALQAWQALQQALALPASQPTPLRHAQPA